MVDHVGTFYKRQVFVGVRGTKKPEWEGVEIDVRF